jgi:hypothetical protein
MQRELGPDSAAFKQLAENQIVPHIGAKLMQKVARLDLEAWHTTLRNGGLAARTIGHAHRVLGKALSDAERDGLVVKNVCRLRKAPKVAEVKWSSCRTCRASSPSAGRCPVRPGNAGAVHR